MIFTVEPGGCAIQDACREKILQLFLCVRLHLDQHFKGLFKGSF